MHYRISPRHLGSLLLETFCPRCFYYHAQLQFKLPFDRPMPGIMFHLDRFEKLIVEAHLAAEGEVPEWLLDLNCVASVEFPSKMTQEFPEYDLTLVGMPDAVFKTSSGKLCLIDYKTAICKGEEDPFMPSYKTQLLGYTSLLENSHIGKVESAALVYFENRLKDYQSNPLDLLSEEGFDVPFSVKIHDVDIDRTQLKPLLERFREFADMKNAPEGLERCKDCARLEQLFGIERGMRNQEDRLRQSNQMYRLSLHPQIEKRRKRAKEAWDLTHDEGVLPLDLAFQDSVPAAQDY